MSVSRSSDALSQRLGFSIAGAQKCGTTALDAYLRLHPALSMGRDKESHFFDRETGVDWRTPDYDILHQAFADDDGRLRGDATPVTLFWTPAQYRMLAYNPQMRFIILLRDPAERAYSHWKMIRGRGQEPLPFGEAIREGRVRILNEGAQSMAARWFSYVERGFYARQLKHLASLFGWERLLILRQDDLSAQPEATLARVTAIAGRRVLIVDCDLRRPNIHRSLSLPNQYGLADFLSGNATLPDVMRTDSRTGADVITAGSPTDNPEEIIRNPLFDQMLFNLRPQYDLILLDAPPVLPVSDTRILAEKASQCVVVVKWRRTPRKLVQLAIRQLTEAGANIAGVALNQVDTSKAARYGSGEVEYYMGRRGSYFKN